jgi:uncharacterized protein (TIGR02246 family)
MDTTTLDFSEHDLAVMRQIIARADAEQAAIAGATMKMISSWATNDADIFAAVFTDDATLILPGDVHLAGREAIRTYMAAAYKGRYRGTTVTGRPLSMRRLSEDVAVITTIGGVLEPEHTLLTEKATIRATWVLRRIGGEWLISAYHNSPVHI